MVKIVFAPKVFAGTLQSCFEVKRFCFAVNFCLENSLYAVNMFRFWHNDMMYSKRTSTKKMGCFQTFASQTVFMGNGFAFIRFLGPKIIKKGLATLPPISFFNSLNIKYN